MCAIMEKIAKEERDIATARINKLNKILISLKRYDDLERTTEDYDYQVQLLDELVPEDNE